MGLRAPMGIVFVFVFFNLIKWAFFLNRWIYSTPREFRCHFFFVKTIESLVEYQQWGLFYSLLITPLGLHGSMLRCAVFHGSLFPRVVFHGSLFFGLVFHGPCFPVWFSTVLPFLV